MDGPNPVKPIKQNDLKSGANKSAWHNRYPQLWAFICPLCETERRVPFQPKLGTVRQIFRITLTTFILTLMSWPWLGWKGAVWFVPAWTVYELIYRWRMRAALACPHCGFDPYLFSFDLNWAKREVEAHWRGKFAEKNIPYPVPKAQRNPKQRPQIRLDSSPPES
jgi:hypothetical protein